MSDCCWKLFSWCYLLALNEVRIFKDLVGVCNLTVFCDGYGKSLFGWLTQTGCGLILLLILRYSCDCN